MADAVVAASYGGPEALSLVSTEIGPPGPGQVTIEVRAAGVNPIDYKLYSGAMGDSPDKLPMPLGMEVAGVVTAVGADANGPAGPLAVGDEVLAYPVTGGYASAVVAPADVVVPKPAELPWELAAGLLLAGSTAVHAVALADVGAGRTVLVHGASGAVGLVAVQLAVAAGATVIGTASERRQPLLRQLGAVGVSYGPGLLERVREIAPNGVHSAIDAVGTDEAVDVSLRLVSPPSLIISAVAFQRGDTGITLIGNGPGADPGTEIRANAWRQLVPLAASGGLTLPVAKTFPLSEAATAHAELAGGHAGGKLVLIP